MKEAEVCIRIEPELRGHLLWIALVKTFPPRKCCEALHGSKFASASGAVQSCCNKQSGQEVRREQHDITTIFDILNELREAVSSNRDMGDKFERLIATHLITDPLQPERFGDLWLWCEWHDRGNQHDSGIDLLAKKRVTSEFSAIPYKFYPKEHSVQKNDIDNFYHIRQESVHQTHDCGDHRIRQTRLHRQSGQSRGAR